MTTTSAATPSGVRIWLMAARVRTLPAAIAPVLVGTAWAGFSHVFHPLRFVAALVGAIFIQIGTNLSNDYSDARRGADTEDRLGPVRGTAGRLAAAAGRRGLDPGRSGLHRRATPVRLRGPGRGVRVPVLRDRRRRRLVL